MNDILLIWNLWREGYPVFDDITTSGVVGALLFFVFPILIFYWIAGKKEATIAIITITVAFLFLSARVPPSLATWIYYAQHSPKIKGLRADIDCLSQCKQKNQKNSTKSVDSLDK